jgi:hypothetical protein
MLQSAQALRNYIIRAKDGDVGKIHEFYFDDKDWTIPYLVVDTGSWLLGRKIIISPDAFGQPDVEAGVLPVALTKEEVRNRPDISKEQAASEHYEASSLLSNYAGPPMDQLGGGLFEEEHIGMDPDSMIQTIKAKEEAEQRLSKNIRKVRTGGAILQSTKQVTGNYIQAIDGEIGHVEDFIIDDGHWTISYLVIDTVNWLPGKKVLVSPQWIEIIDWNASKVYIDLSRAAVKNSPEYDPTMPLDRAYEEQLHRHYNRSGYWG